MCGQPRFVSESFEVSTPSTGQLILTRPRFMSCSSFKQPTTSCSYYRKDSTSIGKTLYVHNHVDIHVALRTSLAILVNNSTKKKGQEKRESECEWRIYVMRDLVVFHRCAINVHNSQSFFCGNALSCGNAGLC